MILAGWGRFPKYDCRITTPRCEADLQSRLAEGALIARGNGRSYGDSAVSITNTVDIRRFNRMLAFDQDTGQLTTEAGVLLGDVISVFLPRGWFPPVTPGTKFVTIGGMIAADVHGKNHHKDGSFGSFVDWVDLMVADGQVLRCSAEDHSDLFAWTVGGMGLTGVILRAAFRLRKVETGWIRQTLKLAPNLDAAISALDASNNSTYSVAWLDCAAKGTALGRSLVLLGEHATSLELLPDQRARPFDTPHRRRLAVPLDAPSFALTRLTVRAFNAVYYRNGVKREGERLVDWDRFFYPLDAVLGWNRIYGRRGLVQFQCVLPIESSREGIRALLTAIGRTGQAAFLAVLKRLGSQQSPFSFPMMGYTLALDFPVSQKSLLLLNLLDRITLDHEGRFYLAKDSRMTAATLHQSDPRADSFRSMREESGFAQTFASAQSQRLNL
jgi:FAD/FMN-containing dehydrogenase